MTIGTQTEFAKHLGVVDSYVTKLKRAGRLILVGKKIDFEASEKLIEETRDPNRDDVTKRHATARSADASSEQASLPLEKPEVAAEATKVDSGFQTSRAEKAKYDALTARADYEIKIGNLIPRADAESAMKFIGATVFSLLENLPGQNASLMVGVKDTNEAEEILREACRNVQVSLGDAIKKRQAELGQGAAS